LGDLKYGRTVHSLTYALAYFGAEMYFVSPPNLRLPADCMEELIKRKVKCHETESLHEISKYLDVIYCTRIQEERFADPVEFEKVRGIYRLGKQMLEEMGIKPNLKILRPVFRTGAKRNTGENGHIGIRFRCNRMKHLDVSAIKYGSVIDHIDSKSTLKVADILNIKQEEQVVLVGMNLSSKLLGKKGIIKIGGKILDQEEVNKIALIAPNATVNIIRDYEVVKKFEVVVPEVIEGIVKCFNPNCISNHDNIKSRQHLISKVPIKLRCHYCERIMGTKDIILI